MTHWNMKVIATKPQQKDELMVELKPEANNKYCNIVFKNHKSDFFHFSEMNSSKFKLNKLKFFEL